MVQNLRIDGIKTIQFPIRDLRQLIEDDLNALFYSSMPTLIQFTMTMVA